MTDEEFLDSLKKDARELRFEVAYARLDGGNVLGRHGTGRHRRLRQLARPTGANHDAVTSNGDVQIGNRRRNRNNEHGGGSERPGGGDPEPGNCRRTRRPHDLKPEIGFGRRPRLKLRPRSAQRLQLVAAVGARREVLLECLAIGPLQLVVQMPDEQFLVTHDP